MTEDKFRDKHNNVLPIEAWLKARQEGEDGLSQLLIHMRKMREVVPVNHRLQAELRKKLLERQKQLMMGTSQAQSKPTKSKAVQAIAKCRSWLYPAIGVAVVFMLAFALNGLWKHTTGQLLLEASGNPQEISRFWTESQPLQPALSPDGSQILVVRGGGLVLLSESGVQLASLGAPEGQYFRSPSWSPDGRQIAFVLGSTGGTEEIKQIAANELMSPAKTSSLNAANKVTMSDRSVSDEKEQKIAALGEAAVSSEQPEMAPMSMAKVMESDNISCSNLVFSPDGKSLAYVTNSAGQSSVWIKQPDGSSRFVTEGDYPTWSPDGKYLVVQRPGGLGEFNLWLINVEKGTANLLGQGERPAWAKNGYLAFVNEKAQERILTFLPDGEPQYSVRQHVPEIRVAYLGKDGTPALKRLIEGEGWLAASTLLVASENRISGMEINWLRQQEMNGERGPKTLVLDGTNVCEGQVFGPDGKWLLFARRDGDTVALVKLRLEERWEKRRD